MKVLVVNNMAPFVRGGAEQLAAHLEQNLIRLGCDAETLRIPFNWNPAERLIDEMMFCRMMRLTCVDRVIALKFPAYLIPHENKVVWLLHQFRQAYDLWDADQSHIPRNVRGEEIRRMIWRADNLCFDSAKAMFCNSPVTRERLRKYNGRSARVLPPPLNDPEQFRPKARENFLFAGGRINAGKRQHLLVEAMTHVREDVRLVIAGPPDSSEDQSRLENLVASLNLSSRVVLDFRHLPRAEYADLMNRAMACAYCPFDEDSFGYVTMEAAQAAKPVLTTSDAGGVLDLIRDQETGLVADPIPRALADKVNLLIAHPSRARQWGETLHGAFAALGLTWEKTIDHLLA